MKYLVFKEVESDWPVKIWEVKGIKDWGPGIHCHILLRPAEGYIFPEHYKDPKDAINNRFKWHHMIRERSVFEIFDKKKDAEAYLMTRLI